MNECQVSGKKFISIIKEHGDCVSLSLSFLFRSRSLSLAFSFSASFARRVARFVSASRRSRLGSDETNRARKNEERFRGGREKERSSRVAPDQQVDGPITTRRGAREAIKRRTHETGRIKQKQSRARFLTWQWLRAWLTSAPGPATRTSPPGQSRSRGLPMRSTCVHRSEPSVSHVLLLRSRRPNRSLDT